MGLTCLLPFLVGAFAFDGLLTLVGFFIDLILGFTPVFFAILSQICMSHQLRDTGAEKLFREGVSGVNPDRAESASITSLGKAYPCARRDQRGAARAFSTRSTR